MGNRLELQTLLENTLGSRNVYFQPPESIKLKYPCIIYTRNAGTTRYADDLPYVIRTQYQITVLDYNPDSEIPGKVAKLQLCRFNRAYTANNLNHDVFSIYY